MITRIRLGTVPNPLISTAWNVCTVALVCAALMGCGSPGYVKASAIEDNLTKVCDRHDAYTQDNTQLNDLQREVHLRSTTLLRKLLTEALEEADTNE